jgi:hypothetical protein
MILDLIENYKSHKKDWQKKSNDEKENFFNFNEKSEHIIVNLLYLLVKELPAICCCPGMGGIGISKEDLWGLLNILTMVYHAFTLEARKSKPVN